MNLFLFNLAWNIYKNINFYIKIILYLFVRIFATYINKKKILLIILYLIMLYFQKKMDFNFQ